MQVTDDPALAEALGRAEEVEIGGVRLRILGRADLLHEKLRAGADPAPRRSKRLQDLADAQALLEVFPELASELQRRRARPPGSATRVAEARDGGRRAQRTGRSAGAGTVSTPAATGTHFAASPGAPPR